MAETEKLTRRIFSVSEFSGELSREIVNRFPNVCVRGEVTNLSKPRSGHWYFFLKDENAQIRAVMFRSSNLRAHQIKEGDEIIACGKPSIYKDRGDLQIIVSRLESAGEGDLQRQFEELKKELLEKGFFAKEAKKPIPVFPKKVAVITSASGAVIHDIQTVTKRRAPALPILLIPAEVQGADAVSSLKQGVEIADSHAEIDLIILARGGGSLEDMAAFNSREIAEAIFNCKTPLISSVGHESDISIADLVADVRAATPSEAAEMATAGLYSLPDRLTQTRLLLTGLANNYLETNKARLDLKTSLLRSPSERLEQASQKLDSLEPLLDSRLRLLINEKQRKLGQASQHLNTDSLAEIASSKESIVAHLSERLSLSQKTFTHSINQRLLSSVKTLEAVSPLRVLARGYSITTNAEGMALTSTEQLSPGDEVTTKLSEGGFISEVKAVKPDKS